MADPLKYAVIERERPFLVETIPEGVTRTISIEDHDILGTRLRLRQVTAADGTRERKLGHEVRVHQGASAIACTSLYLDDAEWDLLRSLPARWLRKTRHVVERDGAVVVIDELDDATLLAEIDDGEAPPVPVPAWLAVIDDVTDDRVLDRKRPGAIAAAEAVREKRRRACYRGTDGPGLERKPLGAGIGAAPRRYYRRREASAVEALPRTRHNRHQAA